MCPDHQEGRARSSQNRADTLRRILNPIIRSGVAAAENVGDGRREKRVDVTPGKEHQRRDGYEPERTGHHQCQQRDRDRFHDEHNGHRVIASDAIGDPAKERARRSVQNLIHRER